MIEVVSGIIVRDGRILLAQRPPSKDLPWHWECAGGKVDGPHESHHSALRRELDEELGITVGDLPEHAIWCGMFERAEWRADRADIFKLFYVVPEYTGTPTPREGQGLGWFTEAEMRGLHMVPGNAEALDLISQLMRMSERRKVAS